MCKCVHYFTWICEVEGMYVGRAELDHLRWSCTEVWVAWLDCRKYNSRTLEKHEELLITEPSVQPLCAFFIFQSIIFHLFIIIHNQYYFLFCFFFPFDINQLPCSVRICYAKSWFLFVLMCNLLKYLSPPSQRSLWHFSFPFFPSQCLSWGVYCSNETPWLKRKLGRKLVYSIYTSKGLFINKGHWNRNSNR